MKKYSKEEIVEQYEKSGKIMYQATLDGDYKTNNREGKRLLKFFKYFEDNREFAVECINDMLCSENVVVRAKAAAYCLALSENLEKAQEVLQEICNKTEYGIFAFNAKMTLDVWKKQGYLQIYTKDKS